MGFNTTVVVMNDALNEIENDSEFGKKLAQAISHLTVSDHPVDVSAGSSGNAATVIESHHADGVAVVAVGENYGERLNNYDIYPYGEGPRKERILKHLADELGYDLHKKRGR